MTRRPEGDRPNPVTRTAKVIALTVLIACEWVLVRYARLDWVTTAFAASAVSLAAGMACVLARTLIRDARDRHHQRA